MDAAQQPPELQLIRDLGYGHVGVLGRRHVIEREENAGHGLHEDQEKRRAAKRVQPADAFRQRPIRKAAPGRRQLEPIFEIVGCLLEKTHQLVRASRSSTW